MPIFPLFCWLFLIWISAVAAWPLSRRVWGNVLPDVGFAAGRVLLLALWTLLAFWLGHVGVSTRFSALLFFPFFITGVLCAIREREVLQSILRAHWKGVLCAELFFFGAFIFFLLLRGFWPDVDNGEKPMDMALISSLCRAEFLPPANPFAAETRLNAYYYFGHLQTALLSHATGIAPRWSYNLMCATLPALIFSALFPLCTALTKKLRSGVLATFLVLCCGTLAPLRSWFPNWFGAPLDSQPYFATSRVIPFTINEYPFFTFTFGDLHAHFFAMSIAVLTMNFAWALWRRGASTLALLLSGATLSALLMTNSWDFPLYTLLVVACLWRKAETKKSLQRIVCLVAIAVVFSFPFWSRLQSGGAKLNLVGTAALDLLPWLLVWGFFIFSWCVVFFSRCKSEEKNAEYFFLCRLALCGVLALVWCEIFWSGFLPPPFHRQDTVFKFGLQAWYLLGVAAVCGILQIEISRAIALRGVRTALFLLVPIALYSSCLTLFARAKNFREFQGFDAWNYLALPEREAAHWLFENARDGDDFFEAEKSEGGDYTEYSRYAYATGVPAVIGPQAHSFQWIGNWEEVFARKNATRALYSSDDAVLRSAVLRRYRARWIIIGELERREYGEWNCARLENSLPVVARFGSEGDSRRVVICHNPLR